ncbi:MAG: Stf0 family sulfotransferase [Puniceicoccaceae bacterium]
MTQRSIFFAATHRSGSTLLLEAIRDTDQLGLPGEYFYPRFIRELIWHNDPKQALAANHWLPLVIEKGISANGVFSAKLFADNLHWLAEHVSGDPWPEGLKSLPGFFRAHFPNAEFISIRRRDKLRQGISLLKAMQSGIWHSNQKAKVIARQPYYDRQRIQWAITNIEAQEKDLDLLFEALGITPKTIYYEDFSEDLESTLAELFDYLGEKSPERGADPGTLKRLSDAQTESWVERFEQEANDAQGPGQALLDDVDSPVFEIQLEQAASTCIPGTRLVSSFRVRNLMNDSIRFLGKNGGRGSIHFHLDTIGEDGQLLFTEPLPVPYELKQEEEIRLEFHSPIPQQSGKVWLQFRAEQKGMKELMLSGSTKVALEVSAEIDGPVRSLFGEYEFTGDNWYYTPWFGYFDVSSWPWVLSLSHGWLLLADTVMDSSEPILRVMDSEMGEWSTSRDTYPNIMTQSGSKLRYTDSKDDQRSFLNEAGEEISVPLSSKAHEHQA